MHHLDPASDDDLVGGLEDTLRDLGARHRLLLAHIARCDSAEVWRDSGCADTAMWLSELCGISNWVAARWVEAARALEYLPALAAALEDATLCLDKVVELARFASPDTEEGLVSWARRVSLATVRRRAELARAVERDEAATEDRARYLRGRWHEGGRVYSLQGCFPADQGAVVEAALGRWAASVPPAAGSGMEGDDEGPLWTGGDADARRADGLVWAASGAAEEPGARRPVVVVHADLEALAGAQRPCGLEGAGIVAPEVARRLACDAHLEVVVHDGRGRELGIGRAGRVPPPWLVRQLRARDGRCTWAGCDQSRFVHAHHIVPWPLGGPTELDNLVLVCGFHHKLVHEHGWRVELGEAPGTARWYRPDGTRHEPGPRSRGDPVDRGWTGELVAHASSKTG